MEILKQTHSELVLRNRPSRSTTVFMAFWSALFIGVPLAMIGGLAYNVGVTRLTCDRVEPAQVRCDRQQSKLFDSIRPPAESYDRVTAARVKTERGWEWKSNRDRRVPIEDNWVALETSRGEVAFVEDVVRVNGTRGSAAEMQAIANDINTFLRSDRESLSLRRDLRLRLGQTVAPMAFLSLFPLLGGAVFFAVLQTEVLTFDGTMRRLRSHRQTLLGAKTWDLPFHHIRDVTLDVHTDSDGDSTYTLKLMLDRGETKKLRSTQHRRAAEVACNAIRAFLRLG